MRQNKHYKKLRRLVHGGTTRLRKPNQPTAEKSFRTVQDEGYSHADDDGVLRMDKPNRLPAALAEASENGENGLMPGPLVITITLAAILFIGVMTWFIAQMPAK